MLRRDAEKLVEIERGYAREVGLAFGMERAELVVQADRGASGRQPEDQVGLLRDRLDELRGKRPGENPLVVENRYLRQRVNPSCRQGRCSRRADPRARDAPPRWRVRR